MEKKVHFVNGAADKGARPYTQAVHVNNQRVELRARFNSLCRIQFVGCWFAWVFMCIQGYIISFLVQSSPLIFLKMLSDDGCNYMSLNVSLELLQWHCWVPHHPNKSMIHPPTQLSPILAGSPSLKRDRVNVGLQKPELDQCFSCLTQYNCRWEHTTHFLRLYEGFSCERHHR